MTDDNCNNLHYHWVVLSIQGDAEIIKLTTQTLRAVQGVLETLAEAAAAETTNDKDKHLQLDITKSSFHASAVTLFGLASLLKLDSYVHTRPFLLCPLWKTIAQLAQILHSNLGIISIMNNTTTTTTSTSLACEFQDLVVENAIHRLTEHIREGTQALRKSIDQRQQQQQHTDPTICIKILGFLLARWDGFQKITTTITTGTATTLLTQLLVLRGLEIMEQDRTNATTTTPFYRTMANKSHKYIHAWWISKYENDDETINKGQDDILKCENPFIVSKDLYATTLFASGKSIVLMDILQQQQQQKQWKIKSHHNDISSTNMERIEFILAIVEELILRTLPSTTISPVDSNRHDLFTRSIRTISKFLLTIEMTDPCIRSQPGRFYGILLVWLYKASEYHPISLEYVLLLHHLHVLGLMRQNQDFAKSLLDFWVRILMDPRTHTTLRQNLATLLIRLQSNDDHYSNLTANTSMEHDTIILLVRETLVDQLRFAYDSLEKEMSFTHRKRKHCSQTPSLVPKSSVANLAIIAKVLLEIKPRFRTGWGILSSIDFFKGISGQQLLTAGIYVAASDFSKLHDFERLIHVFLALWKGQNRDSFKRLREHFLFFTVILLRQVTRFVEMRASSNDGASDQELKAICQVLTMCTATQVLEVAKRDCQFMPSSVFAAIQVLEAIGCAIRASTGKSVLQELGQCFYRLLSCVSWPIRAHALTSLVQFASTIHPNHKNILPHCIPEAMQPLLQSRLRNIVHGNGDKLDELQKYWQAKLLQFIPPARPAHQRFFPVTSTFSILPGSYFMTMPTQGDRSAIVIFPPTENSLKDIRLMLELNENDDGDCDDSRSSQKRPPIFTMQRVDGLSDGGATLHLALLD